MMEQLRARGEAAGERAAARAAERLAGELRAAFPEFDIAVSADAVTIQGRGLWRRWLADPALRWLGGWLR